jgi:hypothetical protein
MNRLKTKLGGWHVGVAAEAFAAAQFARCNCDVSVQYGANQPEYDLLITRDGAVLKVSVKGSQDGSWGITQGLLKNADYHGAIDAWLARHKPRTIFCFVQFKGVVFDGMPRLYLASPDEIAERLKATAAGRGDTVLYESQKWGARAVGAGTIDEVPASWRFTPNRLSELLKKLG